MPKPELTIEKWAVVRSFISPNFEELRPGNHLTGNILGHTNLPYTTLYTSSILSVDFKLGVVETLNTMYRLGEPSEEYQSWFDKRRAAAA